MSGGGGTAVATAPPLQAAPTRVGGAVYTQCAWQRPNGKWLNSKEVAEIEHLAQKYVVVKRNETSGFVKLVARMGIKNDKALTVEKIRDRVSEIGIPFGIFQAYANSL